MCDSRLRRVSLNTMPCVIGADCGNEGYHASGTCAMGNPDDRNAVLDGRLRVRGVRNLRVADVSSVPQVNNGHTQMVAYGIGEGAAEMIREDARSSLSKLTPEIAKLVV